MPGPGVRGPAAADAPGAGFSSTRRSCPPADANSCAGPRGGRLDPHPDAVVPEPITVRIGIPLDACPRRPRRWRRRRRRPRRGTFSICLADVVIPVTAVVPVPVVSPSRIPPIARAPVMVVRGRRRRHRLGTACGQSESGHGEAPGRQNASAQAKVWSGSIFDSHVLGHARGERSETSFVVFT